jgi:AcrR family transcriptional regulator
MVAATFADERPAVDSDPDHHAASPLRPGRKPRFTTDQIVQYAIDIADEHGLESLSMKSLSDSVGLSMMSLYTYFPSKEELIALMRDEVHRDSAPHREVSGSWRAQLEAIAAGHWAMYRRHPWMLRLPATVMSPGPDSHARHRFEREYRSLAGACPDDVPVELLLGTVTSFVFGAALTAFKLPAVPGRAEPTSLFGFGLSRVLDGIGDYLQGCRQGALAFGSHGARARPGDRF